MTTELVELADCPFCGGGEHRVDEKTYWTGMRSELLNVTVRHWCERIEGQPQSLIQITRKTRNEAITAWNTRALASRAGGWLPIESAPKDGAEVDIWCPDDDGGYRVADAYWCQINNKWHVTGDSWMTWANQPTHWRPLPAAPEPLAEGSALAPGCGDGAIDALDSEESK